MQSLDFIIIGLPILIIQSNCFEFLCKIIETVLNKIGSDGIQLLNFKYKRKIPFNSLGSAI